MFGDNPSAWASQSLGRDFLMEDISAWSLSATDEELRLASEAIGEEIIRRERRRASTERHGLSAKNRRVLMCPRCGGRLRRNGKGRYACANCGATSNASTGTSLAAAKLTPSKIRKIIALTLLDCPVRVVGWIADVDPKTAQFWRDRCLDAAMEWSAESNLSKHVWIDEMMFVPARAAGIADDVRLTNGGKLAKEACLGIAVDSSGQAVCKLYPGSGTPRAKEICLAFAKRIEPGSELTHDGAYTHRLLVASVKGIKDDVHKFSKDDPEYEKAMRYMNLLCSYVRFEFEKHRGIKFAKIEAYATFFCYKFTHIRKHGFATAVEYLFGRVCGTAKSHNYRESFRKNSDWRR